MARYNAVQKVFVAAIAKAKKKLVAAKTPSQLRSYKAQIKNLQKGLRNAADKPAKRAAGPAGRKAASRSER